MIDKSVQYLKGVGPQKAKLLAKLGISSLRDLLCHFPREYDDRRMVTSISLFAEQERITLAGKVTVCDAVKLSKRLSVFKAAIDDGTGTAYACFFRKVNPYHNHDVFLSLKEKFKKGSLVIVNGRATVSFGEKQVNVEEFETSNTEDGAIKIEGFKRIAPVYPLTKGITNKWLRSVMERALKGCAASFKEIIDENTRLRFGLMTLCDAVKRMHFPPDAQGAEAARRRLAYDEFLLLETALTLARQKNQQKAKKREYAIKRSLLTPFRQRLGFEFTVSQKKTINEIFADMQKSNPMNRLLMGDVGSGKTVVALSAVLLAIENGYQAVFLAPTEILAEQHFITIKRMLDGLGVKAAILTARYSSKRKEKTALLNDLQSGAIDLLVATHAALEKNVVFKSLGLAVIDEQHRFGVLQRGIVRGKAEHPDMLLMTATPIPRTLTLTLYGDMDISIITELPPGRQPIETRHVNDLQAYEFIKAQIKRGRQAYIVYPLVEESDKTELKAAVQEAQSLSNSVFSDFKVGLIHGQLAPEVKDGIMQSFRENKYDILIATTVIEVGIDIPNASVIAIEHADRFGLATLHQLRGRVGRGKERSYCLLIGEPKTEEAKTRINTMLKHSSGFDIAESDLGLRGPGEFFGTAQHGIIALKAGNIISDQNIIMKAKETACSIIDTDPKLSLDENAELKREVVRQYSGKLDLLSVG